MDYKQDAVFLSISLAGGRIEQGADNGGITQAASLAFLQPATSRLSSTEIADLMTGKNIRVSAMPEGDALTVTVTGSPEDLETGLQLAHALITDGRIEESAFSNWRTASSRWWPVPAGIRTKAGRNRLQHSLRRPTSNAVWSRVVKNWTS